MPHTLDWEGPFGVLKQFSGFVTVAEFLDSAAELHEDPRFDQLHYVINDYSAVTGFDVGEKPVEELAALNIGASLSNPKLRIALVTTDERIKALIGLFTSPDLRSFPTRVFATLPEARAWLASEPYTV